MPPTQSPPAGTPAVDVVDAAAPAASLASSFDRFLGPVSRREFLDHHWGRQHLVIRRNDGHAEASRVFSFADVERYLAVASHHDSARVSIVHNRKERKRRLTDVPAAELYAAFADGATLRFDHMERHWPAIAELAATLSRALGARVKVNSYLTPAGTQGAPVHPDVQDVFALQLEGTKDWDVYAERVHEPPEGHRLLRYLPGGGPSMPDGELEVAESLRVHPGDVLYLPRGVLHRAVAPEDSPSLHLAICVTPIYWVDVIKATAEVASARHPELGDRLPPGFATDPSLARQILERFGKTIERLADPAHLEAALRALDRHREAESPAFLEGQLVELLALDRLDADTVLERRDGPPVQVLVDDEAAELRRGSVRFRGPAAVGPALEHVRDHRRLRIGDLPGPLTDDSRLVLARRLVRDGVLRRSEAGGTDNP